MPGFRRHLAVLGLIALPQIATADDKIFDIQIVDRQVIGDTSTRRVGVGDEVEIRWHADEDVELHLHGYDVSVRVPAGGSATMAFTARVSGRFPISPHGFGDMVGHGHARRPVLYLEVHPE